MAKHKYIEIPETLLELFMAYIKDAKSKPYLKHVFVGKDGDDARQEHERPLTFVGFECYLFEQGIINDLGDYESNKDGRYTEYATIITRIKKFIEKDQFEGAITGIYNANIISRKLGLSDTQKIQGDPEAPLEHNVTLKI